MSGAAAGLGWSGAAAAFSVAFARARGKIGPVVGSRPARLPQIGSPAPVP